MAPRRTAGESVSVEEMEVWERTGHRPERADDGLPPELREQWARRAKEAVAAAPAADEESRRYGDELVRRYFDGQAEARRKRRLSGSKGGKATQREKAERRREIEGHMRGIAHLDNRTIFERVRARFDSNLTDATLEKHYLRPVRRELGLLKRRRRAMPGRE